MTFVACLQSDHVIEGCTSLAACLTVVRARVSVSIRRSKRSIAMRPSQLDVLELTMFDGSAATTAGQRFGHLANSR